MRRWAKIALGGVAATAVAGAASFAPLVRAKAEAQAERRGATLEVGSVRPGAGRVWLRDVKVRFAAVPAAEVQLDAIEVVVSAGFDVRRVVVHGGSVVLRGSIAEVRDQIQAWRAERTAGSGKGGRSTTEALIQGLRVTWYDSEPGAPPQLAWGVRYERDAERETLSADLVRAHLRGTHVDARGPRVELKRDEGARSVERVSAEALSATLDLDALEALLPGAMTRTTEAVASKKKEEPAANTEAPAGFLSRTLPLDKQRGKRLRDGFSRLAQAAGTLLPKSGELDLDGLKLLLRGEKQNLNLGPARLRLSRDGDKVRAKLTSGAQAKQPLDVSAVVPLGDGAVELSVAGGPISLAMLGVREGDMGLSDVERATFEAKASVLLAPDGSALTGAGNGHLRKLTIKKRWLAKDPVRGLDLGWRVKGALAVDGSRLTIQEGELELGKTRLEAKGVIERVEAKEGEHYKLVLDGGVPLASCQTMLESAPEGLVPLLSGMRMSGTFALKGHVELDTRRPKDVVTRWDVTNECRVTATSAEIAPRRFRSTWTREVLGADGRLVQIQSGPGSLTWVPKTSISKHMETAVLICEDGRFFRHRGFDEEAIANSIRMNLEAGKFIRGASTISMQLAKNLYLSRERTLSRKLQEAVLTLLLEQELSKDEMMELYLNVIEFGPGIYGVGPAAAHYFNARPEQLSLGQSLYLASILPQPKRQYFAADGRVSDGWANYLRKLMRIALKIRRIDEGELADGLSEQVTFKVPYSPREPTEEQLAAEGATGAEPPDGVSPAGGGFEAY